MSCMPLPKKFKQLPSSSKKAWKSFTSSLPSKLRRLGNHLRVPKSVTKKARRVLNLKANRGSKTRGGSSRVSYSYYNYKPSKYHYQYQHLQHSATNSPATVYVDRLFGETPSRIRTTSKASTSGKELNGDDAKLNSRRNKEAAANCSESGTSSTINNGNYIKWKEYVSSLPKIRGIDDRAEEFISKFRQEMQLQREQSIVNFQKMLARGV